MKILFFIQLEKIIFLFCYLLFFSLYNFTVQYEVQQLALSFVSLPFYRPFIHQIITVSSRTRLADIENIITP